MSFGGKRVDNPDASPLKKFVSESQIETQRRETESAWQRVRAAAGGSVPSSSRVVFDEASGSEPSAYDPNDTRTLYDRLNSQKQNKQLAYDEAHKLKNQLSVIDTEEAEFLEEVDRVREHELLERQREQNEILKDLRQNALSETEKSLEVKRAVLLGTPIQSSSAAPPKSITSNKLASLRLAVKRKTPASEPRSLAVAEESSLPVTDAGANNLSSILVAEGRNALPDSSVHSGVTENHTPAVTRVVATLPSLVPAYTGAKNINASADDVDDAGDDSDSSDSSNSDKGAPAAGFSLLSRKRKTDIAMIKRRKMLRAGHDVDDGGYGCDGDVGSDFDLV